MPRNKYPEQTVEKILNAAAALFAEKGYAHTTLQDIIDATGLSKGAVYHHFQSKEEIAARVGDRLGTQVTGELARIRDDDRAAKAAGCLCGVPGSATPADLAARAAASLGRPAVFIHRAARPAGKDHPCISGADGPAGDSRRQHSHAGP